MQVEFDKRALRYLHRLTGEVQSQEQTQELRLTEGMPDIGSIIGAWGQVLIRGKEWRGDSISVSGGVMVWALYAPEDGSTVQKVEGWLPFQLKWQLPDCPRDGVIQAAPYLRSVDARSISARKIMLRCVVEIFAEGYVQDEVPVSLPGALPQDLQLLHRQHSVLIPKEAGEKAFEINEDLELPGSSPAMEELIRFSVCPEVIDQKVMGDKCVFRGNLVLHLVYTDGQGIFHSTEMDVPVSQFTQLDGEYGPDAQVLMFPAVTALELEAGQDGRLTLNAGMTCQYLVYDTEELELVEDVYSLERPVTGDIQHLELPVVTKWEKKSIPAEQRLDVTANRVIDGTFLPAAPRLLRQPGGTELALAGQLQALYYDDDQQLRVSGAAWTHTDDLPDGDWELGGYAAQTGAVQGSSLGVQVQVSADLHLQCQQIRQQGFPMITGVELGEPIPRDPDRPSLIIRRAGTDSLWQIAKNHGTTVERIRKANHLEEEPTPGMMLLIPIP